MSKSDADKKVEAVKNGEKCDHKGFYVGYGFECFPLAGGDFVTVSAVICMICSQQWQTCYKVEGPSTAKKTLGIN